jgi:hypothetical protein
VFAETTYIYKVKVLGDVAVVAALKTSKDDHLSQQAIADLLAEAKAEIEEVKDTLDANLDNSDVFSSALGDTDALAKATAALVESMTRS